MSTNPQQPHRRLPAIRPARQSKNRLSERELAILGALSRDFSFKMIAAELGISEFTVQDHIKNIKRKLSTHTAVGAVACAFRLGLIE